MAYSGPGCGPAVRSGGPFDRGVAAPPRVRGAGLRRGTLEALEQAVKGAPAQAGQVAAARVRFDQGMVGKIEDGLGNARHYHVARRARPNWRWAFPAGGGRGVETVGSPAFGAGQVVAQRPGCGPASREYRRVGEEGVDQRVGGEGAAVHSEGLEAGRPVPRSSPGRGAPVRPTAVETGSRLEQRVHRKRRLTAAPPVCWISRRRGSEQSGNRRQQAQSAIPRTGGWP